MSNDEVLRLRKLRIAALRVRAIARAFDSPPEETAMAAWLRRIAGAAWRVSRSVSGRLRAHPYATFQKDAGKLALLANSLRAFAAAQWLKRTTRAGPYMATELSRLERILADARALTCTLELSDTFGRSQAEIRALRTEFRSRSRLDLDSPAVPSAVPASSVSPAADVDWPYLTL